MGFLASFAYEWMAYDFMALALAAVLILSPLYGMLGTMVVDGNMAFFSDSLGHTALTGIALGMLLGLSTPLWAMVIFGLLYAILFTYVRRRGGASTDTTISVFSATGMALGIVLLSRHGGFARYAGYLIGDLLSVTTGEIWAMGAALMLALLFWLLWYNPLLMASVSPILGRSRGIPVGFLEMAFACLLALVVMLSIRWVGVLLLGAMLVLPAATARNLARNLRQYHLFAVGIALLAGVLGLLLSFALDTASGATIVLLLSLCYGGSLIIRP